MPGVSRKDVDAAGGTNIAGSSNVFANGAGVVRIGDAVAGHGIAAHAGPVMAAGSGSVFANSIGICRAGDPASCGDADSGSSNVFIGD